MTMSKCWKEIDLFCIKHKILIGAITGITILATIIVAIVLVLIQPVLSIEPDENGNYHIGDMILDSNQYREAYGGFQNGAHFSGISGDWKRWKDRGEPLILFTFMF